MTNFFFEEYAPGRFRDIDTKQFVPAKKARAVEAEFAKQELREERSIFVKDQTQTYLAVVPEDPKLRKGVRTIMSNKGISKKDAEKRLAKHMARMKAWQTGLQKNAPTSFSIS